MYPTARVLFFALGGRWLAVTAITTKYGSFLSIGVAFSCFRIDAWMEPARHG